MTDFAPDPEIPFKVLRDASPCSIGAGAFEQFVIRKMIVRTAIEDGKTVAIEGPCGKNEVPTGSQIRFARKQIGVAWIGYLCR